MYKSKISHTSQIILSWIASATSTFIQSVANETESFEEEPVKADKSLTNPTYRLGSARTCLEAEMNHDYSHILYPYDD